EPGYDYIYVMDGSGNNVAGSPFTGGSLAGRTVAVTGRTVRIRLTSDGSINGYGFRVTSITGGTTTPTTRDRLRPGEVLRSGESLTSANRRNRLVYQSDGNLVLYDDVTRTVLWASNTNSSAGAGSVSMGTDGNLVVRDGQSQIRFATGTSGYANAYLVVQ